VTDYVTGSDMAVWESRHCNDRMCDVKTFRLWALIRNLTLLGRNTLMHVNLAGTYKLKDFVQFTLQQSGVLLNRS